ncbi:hypothetical protein HY417_00645 [Candidatus Kaiserbacteria bacterium]|nr:hypothetical protein [Candidatus Kaiserbacteria bacterium]
MVDFDHSNMKKTSNTYSFRGFAAQNSAAGLQPTSRRAPGTSSRPSLALATSFVRLARDQNPL